MLSTSLKNGVDTPVIALWLSHEGAETTQIYLHADMTIKEQALARIQQRWRRRIRSPYHTCERRCRA